MTKKYNYQSIADVPVDLVKYVERVSGLGVSEITVDEINELLNEVDEHLAWPWQDSGIEN